MQQIGINGTANDETQGFRDRFSILLSIKRTLCFNNRLRLLEVLNRQG